MSIPVIDVDDIPWRYRSDLSDADRRRYFHIESALELEAVVRKEDGFYSVLVIQMNVAIEEEFNISDAAEANSLAREWMEDNS